MNQDRWPGCHDKPSWKCTKDQMTSQKLQSRPDSSMTRTVEKQKIIKFPSAPTQNFWLRKQIQRWGWMTEFFFLFYDWVLILKSYSGIQLKSITAFSAVLGPHPAVLRLMPASALRFTLVGLRGRDGVPGTGLGLAVSKTSTWLTRSTMALDPAFNLFSRPFRISHPGLNPGLTPVCHDLTR